MGNKMAGIILGEFSQTICSAFRALGHEVYSCDVRITEGNPDWHYQDDWNNVIDARPWNFAILHTECTEVALSGNRYYGQGKELHHLRLKKMQETPALWERLKSKVPYCVLEQPMNCLDQKRMGTRQIIQPYFFGAKFFKETWLYLSNVDPLEKTDYIKPPERFTREFIEWSTIHHASGHKGKEHRQKERARTDPKIAAVMAQQWGKYV